MMHLITEFQGEIGRNRGKKNFGCRRPMMMMIQLKRGPFYKIRRKKKNLRPSNNIT